ncbi:MAG: hypothetical protein JSU03_10455 [Bacteroidetes bacterium]|nr:hypothetical protein [Bacteroidota bacterium]
MKYFFIFFIAGLTIISCARKNVPAAGKTSAQSPAFATPVDSVSTTLSAEKMAQLGHQTYTAKCGRCHELKKVDDFTAQEWDPILASMSVKAKLSKEETANVLAYVTANAKK